MVAFLVDVFGVFVFTEKITVTMSVLTLHALAAPIVFNAAGKQYR